jgi:hypothetical protein
LSSMWSVAWSLVSKLGSGSKPEINGHSDVSASYQSGSPARPRSLWSCCLNRPSL